MRRRTLMAGAGAILLTGAAVGWFATAGEDVSGAVFSGRDDGVAIKGTDPVAYFTQGAPVDGTADHATRWNGREWHFSSAENKAAFDADPTRYAPQYGGFCAFAAAKGTRAKIEPDAWSIVDGKLYLNYDRSIRERWEGDRATFIAQADERWPKLGRE